MSVHNICTGTPIYSILAHTGSELLEWDRVRDISWGDDSVTLELEVQKPGDRKTVTLFTAHFCFIEVEENRE